MQLRDELKSAGVFPTGPCSAWPEHRNAELRARFFNEKPQVKANGAQMAKNLAKTAMQGIKNGKVSEDIRNERYAVCQSCPSFIQDTKRCSECGCFMEAKTWVGGNQRNLCPLKKWKR